ncbi:MAG: nicotinate-nucleotide adenylyltransferase [Sphingobacteriia bacterium]|jgi:nicotinate-nucleotide adenylyltransferase|nr:nicotinate (nicotinamide) nucleotide adenylyltransferase [Paludibacteraceae bacterium]NCA79471.1 nicotinate-nucleotide adenylyltransferase [Sphingobacteriia bacterium]
MQKHLHIGLYFGSFNPIHNGHLSLANYLIDNNYVDEIWLVVSPQNPFKQNKLQLPAQTRFSLAKKAVGNYQHIKVSDIEFDLPQPNYTINTLRILSQTYPLYKFSLIIGADNVNEFNRWKSYEDILKNYSVLVYPRTEYPINELLPSMYLLKKAPLFPFSSTTVREKIMNGEDISKLVPASIKDQCIELYIQMP